MKLRDLRSTRGPNDGTRPLVESVLVPEVNKAIADWMRNAGAHQGVLIGGVAFSHHSKPRMTTDVDLLFLSSQDIPTEVSGFRRHRPGAFEHKQTGVEVEVLSPQSINMPQSIAAAIFSHAKIVDGMRIATPSGIIASKLGRFSLQDQSDIVNLINLGNVDMAPYHLPKEWEDRLKSLEGKS